MKNNITLILLLVILGSSNLLSQNTNLLLLRSIEDRVDELITKLELTEIEANNLTGILAKSTSKLASLDMFGSNIDDKRATILEDRDNAIKNILGANRLKVFKLLEEIKVEALYEEYQILAKELNIGSIANEALIDYRLKYILPKLSMINQEFVSSLSIDNIIKLKAIRFQYYSFAERIEKNLTNPDMFFSDYISNEQKKDLNVLLSKYNTKMELRKTEIEKLRTKWSNDQDLIIADFLADQNLSVEQKLLISKGQFKVREELFNLHLIMIIPQDKLMYLENLDLMFNQQQYFQKVINNYK